MKVKFILATLIAYLVVASCSKKEEAKIQFDQTINASLLLRVQAGNKVGAGFAADIYLPMDIEQQQKVLSYSVKGTEKSSPRREIESDSAKYLRYEWKNLSRGYVSTLKIDVSIGKNLSEEFQLPEQGELKEYFDKLLALELENNEGAGENCFRKMQLASKLPLPEGLKNDYFVGMISGQEQRIFCWVSYSQDNAVLIWDVEKTKLVTSSELVSYIPFRKIVDVPESTEVVKYLFSGRGVDLSLQ